MHPEITMHTHCLGEYMDFIYATIGRAWPTHAVVGEQTAKAGADFLICPDNTIHPAFDLVAPRSPLPWLHIVEEVAAEASSAASASWRHRHEVHDGRNGLSAEACRPRASTTWSRRRGTRPASTHIIFDELVNGIFTGESRTYFQRVIGGMSNQGCDAVVLGCTEIPLLIDDATSPLPTLDSTRILARAAIRRALATE